ncbi:hypothetical protein EYF80_037194 [Liparis tanakae]|uniref:Uncharacterized protein n=1 Tax=Liparis tanakae TaxID=230148 RepID=A0A4Z2GGL4_9TELE|nr:hypothetical protein EYF80_037194 [Liparis tanakae]
MELRLKAQTADAEMLFLEEANSQRPAWNGISPEREQLSRAFMKVVQVSSRRKRPPMSFLQTLATRENTILPQSFSTAVSLRKK